MWLYSSPQFLIPVMFDVRRQWPTESESVTLRRMERGRERDFACLSFLCCIVSAISIYFLSLLPFGPQVVWHPVPWCLCGSGQPDQSLDHSGQLWVWRRKLLVWGRSHLDMYSTVTSSSTLQRHNIDCSVYFISHTILWHCLYELNKNNIGFFLNVTRTLIDCFDSGEQFSYKFSIFSCVQLVSSTPFQIKAKHTSPITKYIDDLSFGLFPTEDSNVCRLTVSSSFRVKGHQGHLSAGSKSVSEECGIIDMSWNMTFQKTFKCLSPSHTKNKLHPSNLLYRNTHSGCLSCVLSNTCLYLQGDSVSESWAGLMENGSNYCSLKNLIEGESISQLHSVT